MNTPDEPCPGNADSEFGWHPGDRIELSPIVKQKFRTSRAKTLGLVHLGWFTVVL